MTADIVVSLESSADRPRATDLALAALDRSQADDLDDDVSPLTADVVDELFKTLP